MTATSRHLTADDVISLVSERDIRFIRLWFTDVLGNLSPESLLGDGSLVDRYPLSAYALDFHVDVGVAELSGVPPTILIRSSVSLFELANAVSGIGSLCMAMS